MNDLINIEDQNRVDALRANLGNLAKSDLNFANSLLSQYDAKGWLSDKQMQYVVKFAALKPPKAPIALGDLSGLQRLFDKARRHLKRPAITLQTKVGVLRISVAGPNARQPGTINVAEAGAFGFARWFGRIQPNGSFEPAANEPTPEGLVEALQLLGADPAKAAGEHGRLTGVCCFCNTPLKDGRSTAVGYGPICAGHYDLPWGEAKTDLAQMSA